MKPESKIKEVVYFAGAFLLISSLTVGCSGCGGGAEDAAGAAGMDAGTGVETPGGTDAGAQGSGNGHGGSGDGHDATHMDGRDANVASDGTKAPETPAEERAHAVEDLNGMRATLVAELDGVRGRLKQGGRTADEAKADQTRAAELAQGLERLDRLIKKTTDANDVTWTEVRESSMKEAGEFRTWMAKYGMNVAS
ncbi:MAG: hypothetical protein JNM31_14675 [Flavobacteriales bacterium]|nr:hypothetical protein [Flavobacteriales bacterium]